MSWTRKMEVVGNFKAGVDGEKGCGCVCWKVGGGTVSVEIFGKVRGELNETRV